jgi:hypothetical protein
MTAAERALDRARTMLGTPFCLHGRDARGVDCVGLAGLAWGVEVPSGYAMRGTPRARIERALASLRFVPAATNVPGAIVLGAPGPGQLHLAIATGRGVIHADAGLRRVVERDAPLGWPLIAAWIRED